MCTPPRLFQEAERLGPRGHALSVRTGAFSAATDCVAFNLDAGVERTQILAELREGAALDEQDENDDSYAFHVPHYTRSAWRDVCERRVSDYG